MAGDIGHTDNEDKIDTAKVRLRYSLDELVAGVTPDEAHQHATEVDWGPDVGRELVEEVEREHSDN